MGQRNQADLAQLLGLITPKKRDRMNKQINRRNAQINSPKYKGNTNKTYSPIMKGNKDVGFTVGFRQNRDPRDKPRKQSTSRKASSGRAPVTTRQRMVPTLQAGYMPESLQGLIRPVGSFDMPGEAGDYGPRIHPIHKRHTFHTGLDMSEAAGTPIYAATSGYVARSQYDPAYGNQVILYHGQNKEGIKYDTMYGHLQMSLVKEGQKVAQGDKIGYVGSTGMSTGNHLHFETWENKRPVNPMKYLGEKDRQDLKKMIAPEPSKDPKDKKLKPTTHKYERAVFGFGPKNERGPKRRRIPASVAGEGDDKLEDFLNSVAEQESGNNYQAVGVPTKYGTAYGKYQILDSNFTGPGGWDKDALGRDIGLDEYLHHGDLQEMIARKKLSDYYREFGAEGAAKAWYGGPALARVNSDRPQYGGPSLNDYARQVLGRM